MVPPWQEVVVAVPLLGKLLLTLFQIFARKRLAAAQNRTRSRSAKKRRARREEGQARGGEGGEGGGEGGGGGGEEGGVEVGKRDRRRAGDVLNQAGRRGAATNSMSLIEVRFWQWFENINFDHQNPISLLID